jgi:hypothetical protein
MVKLMCEVKTLWDKWGWGNQRHMKHDMHDKLMINKHKSLVLMLYWNDVFLAESCQGGQAM